MQTRDDGCVMGEVVLPRLDVHVGQVNLDLAADRAARRQLEVVVVGFDVADQRRSRSAIEPFVVRRSAWSA